MSMAPGFGGNTELFRALAIANDNIKKLKAQLDVYKVFIEKAEHSQDPITRLEAEEARVKAKVISDGHK